jgi:curli biogenesis system outer membrane secretion channel CsgG
MKFQTFSGLSLLVCVLSMTVNASPEGPKKRVAIQDFKDKSGGATPWWADVGAGIADMISAALVKSGKCVVLEREPPAEKATGASLILTGAVTEFGVQHQDVNVGSFNRASPYSGNAGIERETARCVLDLRFVDTTTGRVIAAEHAVGEASAHHVTEEVDSLRSIKFGTERFDQTLIGKATRQTVDRAVALIEKNLAAAPWYGRIIKVDGGNIFVNTGIEDGRCAGNEFDVVRPGEALFDPGTGEALGTEKTPVGRIRLVAILGPRLARAVALEQTVPQTGDIIQ